MSEIQSIEQPVVRNFLVGNIRPHNNAREHFDSAELQELGASMQETRTVLQPLVGVLLEDGITVELIAGERRWRAAQLVGIKELPVILRLMPTEKEWLKWNLIENLQRVNLRPIETAKRVKALMQLTNESGQLVYSIRGLAEELGKRLKFIQMCLHVMDAPERVQEAVNTDLIGLEVGALIGGLPPSMHEQAALEIVFREVGGPMKRDAAALHIANNFRRDLRKASFDQNTTDLIPGVPACKKCPYWGGNNDEVEGRAKEFICLNPSCFDAKQAKANEVVARLSEENDNTTVLNGPNGVKLFEKHSGELRADSPYVELDRKPEPHFLKPANEAPKWRDILEETVNVPVVIAFDADGKQRNLVDKAVALKGALASKHKDQFKASESGGGLSVDIKTADEKKQETAIKKVQTEAEHAALLEACGEFLQFMSVPWTGVQMMSLLELVMNRCMQDDDLSMLCQVLKPDLKKVSNPVDTFDSLVAGMIKTNDQILGLLAMALLMRSIRFNGIRAKGDAEQLAKAAGFRLDEWEKIIQQRKKQAVKDLVKDQVKEAKPKKVSEKTDTPLGVSEPEKKVQGDFKLTTGEEAKQIAEERISPAGFSVAKVDQFLDPEPDNETEAERKARFNRARQRRFKAYNRANKWLEQVRSLGAVITLDVDGEIDVCTDGLNSEALMDLDDLMLDLPGQHEVVRDVLNVGGTEE